MRNQLLHEIDARFKLRRCGAYDKRYTTDDFGYKSGFWVWQCLAQGAVSRLTACTTHVGTVWPMTGHTQQFLLLQKLALEGILDK